ncbi:MAG: SpoIVB peptidase, partial [Ruminococcus sp.]|nr:SpoIVB peptidase [Ruminococcus sp.]
LKVNDIIKEVNRIPVRTNEDLQNAAVNCEGKPISFIIERDGDRKEIVITPQKNNMGVYLLGAWIRDSCAGIGTISFYDKDKNYFAALGHGICDNDTSALLPLGSAEIVKANISSVTKSVDGKAGSLNGYFGDETIGTLTENTPLGIYGEPNSGMLDSSKEIEIADYSEIEKGEAEIYTTIDGENAACYTAEITKLCNADESSNENFVIKITDKSLLDNCGGIVQGMSGSPIVQNGKLVGAITHVFINNTAEGYGIAAQFMASNYE